MERRGFLATLFAIPAALALKPAVAPVKAEDWAADYFSRGITIPPFSEWERANPNLGVTVTEPVPWRDEPGLYAFDEETGNVTFYPHRLGGLPEK
jgi:hypothetical protein